MNTLKDCVLVGYVHIMPISFIPMKKKKQLVDEAYGHRV